METTKLQAKGLTKRHVLAYCAGDLGGCMTFAILGSFLTPYYLEVAGMSTTAIAGMFLLLKVWDAINDPMMGTLLDKSFARNRNPKGKFRPWMMRSAPILAISAVLLFTAPSFFTGTAQVLVAFVTYLIYEASYTMFNIPYGSLLAAMANTDEERAKLSSARGFGAMIGNIIPLIAFPLIIDGMSATPQLGYTAGVAVCAAIGLVSCVFSAKCSSERNLVVASTEKGESDADNIKFTDILVVFKKNRPFVALCVVGFAFCIMQYIGTTLGVYMYRDVLGSLSLMSVAAGVGMVFSVVFLSIAPKLAKKFGLERFLRATLLFAAIGYVVLFFIGQNPVVYMIGAIICSGFSGMTVYMQWGMVGEAIDYNEYITGKRTEGSIYGVFNFMRRAGQALGSSAAVFLLGVINYVPNAEAQTESVILGIRMLVVLLPAVFVLICWASFQFIWNITPEVRAQMAAHKAASAE